MLKRALQHRCVPTTKPSILRFADICRGACIDQGAAASTAPAYKLLKPLGKGTFGTTYLAQLDATAELVALKRIDALNSLERDAALAEYELMLQLQHALLVGARGVIVEPQELGQFRISIVMEYCDGGDLGQYVRHIQFLTEMDACRILKSVVAALDVLHSRAMPRDCASRLEARQRAVVLKRRSEISA